MQYLDQLMNFLFLSLFIFLTSKHSFNLLKILNSINKFCNADIRFDNNQRGNFIIYYYFVERVGGGGLGDVLRPRMKRHEPTTSSSTFPSSESNLSPPIHAEACYAENPGLLHALGSYYFPFIKFIKEQALQSSQHNENMAGLVSAKPFVRAQTGSLGIINFFKFLNDLLYELSFSAKYLSYGLYHEFINVDLVVARPHLKTMY